MQSYSHEVYTLDYFLKKFEEIPEEYIGTSEQGTDAFEWCGLDEGNELFKIVKPWCILSDVCDGTPQYINMGATPKQRLINMLLHIKKYRLPYLYD